MWWNAIAGHIQGMTHGQATNALNAANNRISALNAEVSNRLRAAANAAEGAKGNLARWVQSVNNNKVLEAGGRAMEANLVNFRRQSDANVLDTFRAGLQEAEQLGAMAASQAAAGVSGTAVDMVNESVLLRDSIVRQRMADVTELAAGDTARRAGAIMSQMVGGLDQSIIQESFDYNIDVAREAPILSKLAYGVRGAAEHMGGGGAINSGRREAQASYEQEVRSGSLSFRQRSSNPYDLADHAYDNKVRFAFNENNLSDDSPYTIDSSEFRLSSSEGGSYWDSYQSF